MDAKPNTCTALQAARSSPWPFDHIGRPSDTLIPRGQVCQNISSLLGKVYQEQLSFSDAASSLPDAPGIAVDGVGTLPLPLCEEVAMKIVDSAVVEQENLWVISSHHIHMKNHLWTAGIQILAERSSQQLGYKDVVLQPALVKMMVVGPGGKLDRQQDSDIGHSVATLAVILPSEYTGGDWVTYDDAEGVTRHDMGKEAGIAAFKSHYVAFAAGVSFAVEKVTSGYCVAMVYSLCLPERVTTCHVPPVLLRKKVAEAINQLKGGPDDADSENMEIGEDEILALLLSKSFTLVEGSSVTELCGVDRARYELLLEANKLLPPSKKLVFYLASFGIEDPDIEVRRQKQTVYWFSQRGERIGLRFARMLNWTEVFNFLNPDNETLSSLWEIDSTNLCRRTALVCWPRSVDITNAVKLFGVAAAVPVIISHDFISVQTLRSLLENERCEGAYFHFPLIGVAQEFKVTKANDVLLLCRKLGTAIINLGDVKLVDAFFKKYVSQLRDKKRVIFIQFLPDFVRKFGWKEAQASILTTIDGKSYEASLNRALELADALRDNPEARHGLTAFAVEKSQSWNLAQVNAFAASKKLFTLLKHILACRNLQMFVRFSAVLKRIHEGFLGAVIDLLANWMDETSLPEYRATLLSLATKRRKWLLTEIEDSKRPFLWEITKYDFPDSPQILMFLQGPDVEFKICGFSSISKARDRVKVLSHSITGGLKFVAEGRGRDACVRILKTGGQFDPRRKRVLKYEAEINRLEELVSETLPQDENTTTVNVGKPTVGTKRLREEDDADIVLGCAAEQCTH
ncbi:hypothetical protein DVH05_008084 [Phytophthora capsici]|nr:hypothetical protein DVH05_008084 [Phytophthora capsici]|eukprot:jgi/Phyca11/97732/e_gw1.2.546.1